MDVSELLLKLIDIPSVTGTEAAIGHFLADYLTTHGFIVTRLPVAADRFNVLAQLQPDPPQIVLQAHMDVVPPHLPAATDATYIYGRGACDTKGAMASMIVAAHQAQASGRRDFGLLFTVGEEVDFAGVKQVQAQMREWGSFFIVGEPTQLQAVQAHYGILVLRVVCQGRAAHSSNPALGENAIDKLVAVLHQIEHSLPMTTASVRSVVQIAGGVADNIIPDQAEALFSWRIAPGDTTDYVQQMQDFVGDQAEIQVQHNLPPVATTLPHSLQFLGDGQLVKYCTELTYLQNGIVFGPGNIADAHTATEKVSQHDLQQAVAAYTRMLLEYAA